MSNRDRIKQLCLHQVKSAGYSDDQAAVFFTESAAQVRNMRKEAGVGTTLIGGGLTAAALLSTAALLGIPMLSGSIGYAVGQGARNAREGTAPTIDELKQTDEIAAYKKNTQDIYKRVLVNRAKENDEKKKSVRRMF